MLGMVRHDNMRWVFATTLCRFCEAITSYVANLDRAPNKSITVSKYSQQMYTAFEVLFNVWLNSKEAKVSAGEGRSMFAVCVLTSSCQILFNQLRLAVVEALGNMTHILAVDKLEEILPRLVPGMLGLYKKFTGDILPITQVRCMGRAKRFTQHAPVSSTHTLGATACSVHLQCRACA